MVLVAQAGGGAGGAGADTSAWCHICIESVTLKMNGIYSHERGMSAQGALRADHNSMDGSDVHRRDYT